MIFAHWTENCLNQDYHNFDLKNGKKYIVIFVLKKKISSILICQVK